MRIVFGIGNPGIRYQYTRHNAGFLFLDFFAGKNGIVFKETRGDFLEVSAKIGDQDYSLVKPVTFVNNCGIAAKQVFDKYRIKPENLLVVCDDANLNEYMIRVRLSGGDGGHNGLSSIIYHLMTDNFPRIRIGVGKNPNENSLAEYVLSEFTANEIKEYKTVFNNYSSLIDSFITGGNKKMLETNSLLFKSENQNNLNKNI